MDAMSVMKALWTVLTIALAVLLIYRSALSTHEDNQIFLDRAEAHLENEQRQLAVRMDRLRPIVNTLGAASGTLVLLMAGLWLWRSMKGM